MYQKANVSENRPTAMGSGFDCILYPPTVIDGGPGYLVQYGIMMNDQQRKAVRERLSRIEGQVRGIQRMVDEDRYCMEILAQTRSAVSALRAVENKIMESHLQTCVVEAMQSGDAGTQQEKIGELVDVLTHFRK